MATEDKLKRTVKIENVDTRQSPPKAIVDCSPLQPAISKNKEALKIKLMVRRPIAQLVDQGIIPSLKSSPALHEQRKQLERAKTGDILKAKIQQRPDRQELERRHILEHDEGHVDPSLAERQRMLKKARLADQLNSQLSHRPGPLELIAKNILHTEEPIERIVKEGLISFKATSEGLLNRPQQPNGYITYEDDSQSSEGDQQSPAGQDSNESTTATAVSAVTTIAAIPSTSAIIPLTNENNNTVFTTVVTQAKLPPAYYPIDTTITKPAPVEPIQVKPETTNLFNELCQQVITIDNQQFVPNKSDQQQRVTLLPASSTSFQVIAQPVQNSCKTDAPGKHRKKNKLKPISKTRTIKFHEYKGPPNAQKNGLLSLQPEETSYQLLLKQQNCLLEYLEGLHKNLPSTIAANNTKPNVQSETQTFSMMNNFMQQASPATSTASSTKPASPISNVSDTNTLELSKLEKMKVSDLKLLLKTRNLPVSGPKPQLIERLRPFVQPEVSDMMTSENGTMDDDTDNASRISPISMETDSMEMHEQAKSRSNVDLLREQQRKIDELQRKLKESQQELHQMQMKQSQSSPAVILTQNDVIPNKTEALNQKQIFKQQLEAKIQKDKLQKLENLQKLQMEQQQQQQQQQQEMQRRKQENAVKINETFAPKPIVTTNFTVGPTTKPANEFVWNGESTILLVNFPDDKKYVLSSNPHGGGGTMQNFLVPISTNSPNINTIVKKINLSTQIQPPPPPPPVNLHLTQITAPKISSHPMNVDTNKQHNANKMENILEQQQQQQQQRQRQSPQQQQQQQQSQQQTLPSINTAITMANSTDHALHNATNLNNVLMSNVAATLPFNTTPVKKEFSLFDSTSASDSNMIPNDLLLSANAMDTLSPMPQSNCEDSCNSFDLFLSEAAQSHSDAGKMQDHHHHHHHDHDKSMLMDIKKEQTLSSATNDPCSVDLKTFDDLELMELMGQQLDMDISDDSCQPMTVIKDELNDRVSNSGLNSSQQHMITSCRRDMNPSLQPSLSELIQQQQQQQQQQQNQHRMRPQQSLNNHLSNHRSNSSSNNDTNNNLSSSLDSNPNNNLADYNNPFYLGTQNNQITPASGLHLGSMDIEYFDNTLAQFDFALPQSSTATTATSSSSPMNHHHQSVVNFDSNDSHLVNAMNVPSNVMTSTASYFNPNASANVNNHVLDLFNIDDFKMSGDSLPWSEVDYAV